MTPANPDALAETLRLTEAEWRDRESLRQHWDDFCDADPVPAEFIDKMEDAGFVTLRKVTRDDLNSTFSAEKGIEKGGWVWELTDLGRQALSPPLPSTVRRPTAMDDLLPHTPANPYALADALARFLIEDKFAATLALRRSEARKAARLLIAGPLAPLLADLQRVTAERDAEKARADRIDAKLGELNAAVRECLPPVDVLVAEREAAEARAAQLQAEVEAKDRRIAELSEAWTDEAGTVWPPPTAWAYAKACAALNKHRAEGEALRAALKEISDACPVTCDMSLAHDMAATAAHALAARAATAKEGQTNETELERLRKENKELQTQLDALVQEVIGG